MKRKKIALTVFLSLVFCLAVGGAALAMSSSNYDLPWTVLSAGGGDRGSSNYALGDTAGQSSAIGLSQSTNYRLGSGYWYGVTVTGVPPEADILAYYRGLDGDPTDVSDEDLLQAAYDWANHIIPGPEFSTWLTDTELLELAYEWAS